MSESPMHPELADYGYLSLQIKSTVHMHNLCQADKAPNSDWFSLPSGRQSRTDKFCALRLLRL